MYGSTKAGRYPKVVPAYPTTSRALALLWPSGLIPVRWKANERSHFSYNIGKPLICNIFYIQLVHIYVIPTNNVFRLIKGQIITISIALQIIIEILTMKL